MRLLEVIRRSASYLEERGVESPRLQVEWILSHTLRRPRLQLYLEFDRALDEAQLDSVREAVRRRGLREPLQHVLGTAAFAGLELEVSPAALIPRPETELLAERAWTWLQDRAASGIPSSDVLDWGTGTGCLAFAISRHAPGARIVAVDQSPEALALARRNAARLPESDRITFHHGDGCRELPSHLDFDLVVSNPPYIPTAELDSLQPEVRDHDPRTALDGGPDGLDYYRRLAMELPCRLRSGGALLLEFGDGQGPAVTAILEAHDWTVAECHRDHSGRERFLLATRLPAGR
ncbi:MAG: peptide chain release factor N(5)-glutamine methyltransferase [Verrucomicrobiae bacterium]|nr:peptide chain release factor N(5)-glutamine methyltransferase [Verrucomicrobiae bacterium]